MPAAPAPQPVRVCLLNDHLGWGGTTPHGVCRYFLTLVPQLDPARVAVQVAILRGRDALARPFEAAGIPITFFGRGRLDPRAWADLRRLVVAERIQVLHAQGYASTTLARALPAAVRPRVVLHSHDADDAYPAWLRGPDRWLAGREDAALAASEDARRFFEAVRGVRGTRVLHNGIDPDVFLPADAAARATLRTELALAPDTPLVACVARLRPEKGVDLLVRALPALARACPQAVTLAIGDGPEREALERLAAELGVAGRVRFLGYRDDALRLAAAADAVAIPSRREGLPFALLEALALARPVVAFAVGGLAEAIEPDRSGLLCPPEDADALGSALGALLADPARLRALGAGARRRALDFDVRRHAAELMALYERLAAGA